MDNLTGPDTPSKRRSIAEIQEVQAKKQNKNDYLMHLEEKLYILKTAANVELIYCSLKKDLSADGFTHALYLKVNTKEKNWVRDNGILHTASMRTSKDIKTFINNPPNWQGKCYPRRYYARILGDNVVSTNESR